MDQGGICLCWCIILAVQMKRQQKRSEDITGGWQYFAYLVGERMKLLTAGEGSDDVVMSCAALKKMVKVEGESRRSLVEMLFHANVQEQQKKEGEERKRKEQEAAEEAARKEAEERRLAAEAAAEAERKAAEQMEAEERQRIEEQKSKELAQIQVMLHWTWLHISLAF